MNRTYNGIPSSSPRDLFVLGMISRRPMYGHEIMQTLSVSNARLWIGISDKHVYHVLRKLEQQGFIRGTEERAGRRPPRRRFEITPAGRIAFAAMLADEAHQHAPSYSPFDTVLAMLAWGDVTDELALRLLRRRRDVLAERTQDESPGQLKEIERRFGRVPRAMVQKGRSLLAAEKRWLDTLIEEATRLGWDAMRIRDDVLEPSEGRTATKPARGAGRRARTRGEALCRR